MQRDRHPLSSNCILTLLLILVSASEARGQTTSWKTFADTLDGYEFSYPPKYEVRYSRADSYLIDGKLRIRFYTENLTGAVRRGYVSADFTRLSIERTLSMCMADSPDCSISCTLERSEPIPSANGLAIIAVTRKLIDTCEPGQSSTLDPTYVVNISRPDSYVILIIGPEEYKPAIPPDIVRSIITTIRLRKD